MTTKNFKEIAHKGASRPGHEARVAAQREEALRELAEYSLAQLRQFREVTQVELAHRLGIAQPGISRLEKQDDRRVSTVRDYVEALGGRLELVAVFGDDEERIAIAI